MPRALVLLASLLLGTSLLGTASAASGPVDRQIQGLFWAITGFAVLVAIIVYGAMFWFLIRYRRGVAPEPTSKIEGDRRLEVIWTVFPSIIVLLITLISVPVLEYTDTAPVADTHVTVVAQQFSWSFTYEDGTSTLNELWIQEDIVVHLTVTSMDVIHSFAVPELGVKIDAIPNRDIAWWLQADEPGDYLNQCAEFCGVGHYGMRATIHVFPAGSQPRIFGPPPQAFQITEVELREDGGNATAPWSIIPPSLSFPIGTHVHMRVWNNGTSPHDFRIDAPVNGSTPVIAGFSSAVLEFNITAGHPSPIGYGPSDPGTRTQGMVGSLTIETGRVVVIVLEERPCPGVTDPSKPFCIRTEPYGDPLRIARGERIVFEIRNEGQLGHNFRMDEPFGYFYSAVIPAGQSVFFGPLEFGVDARGKYWCDIAGHRALGMEADFVVGNPPEEQVSKVPAFEMMSITLAIGVPATFAYMVHHARRPEDA